MDVVPTLSNAKPKFISVTHQKYISVWKIKIRAQISIMLIGSASSQALLYSFGETFLRFPQCWAYMYYCVLLEWYVGEQLLHPMLSLYCVWGGRSFAFLFELISKRWMCIHLRVRGLCITNEGLSKMCTRENCSFGDVIMIEHNCRNK